MSETFRGPGESSGCASCPCAVNGAPQRPIRGAGSLGTLAIVGEGPSTEEVHQGWPFVGPSGKLLQQVFNSKGIDRHSIWITNAILCQRPQSEDALKEAIVCCRPRLQHELELVAPKTTLALGGSAAQALQLPVKAIKQARGTCQASPVVPGIVITALHPAAILRGGGAGGKAGGSSAGKNKMNVDAQYIFLESDVEKAFRFATNGPEVWSDDIELLTDASDVSLAKLFQFIDQTPPPPFFAIDLEWGKDESITWLGIATEQRAVSCYLPKLGPLGKALCKRFGETSVPKLFHNLQADVPIWENQIGPLSGIFEDTMLMHHAAFPGAAHDLQNVASQFLPVPPWKADRKNEEKDDKRTQASMERLALKQANKVVHDLNNGASAEAAAKRKHARQQKHLDNNMALKLLKMMEGK